MVNVFYKGCEVLLGFVEFFFLYFCVRKFPLTFVFQTKTRPIYTLNFLKHLSNTKIILLFQQSLFLIDIEDLENELVIFKNSKVYI